MSVKKIKLFQRFFVILLVFLLFIPSIISGHIVGLSSKDDLNASNNINSPKWYEKPSSYSELVNWYKTLESFFPNYIEIVKANELYETGTVDGGYDLYYVRITNETRGLHKPEVLFLGSPHGDETVGTIGLYWFTHWFMRKTRTSESCVDFSKEWLNWLLDNREIYIVISQNPYGFDHNRRLDGNGWDLNREADYDGPGEPTGGIWGSVNGKTLRAFVDNHTIRLGCDFHGGARMILYPWSSTYKHVFATSRHSGKTYSFAPPDFHFFDIASLRLGEYIGSYGGELDQDNIGTIPTTVGYEAKGALSPWAYAANIEKHPNEDCFVNDEIFGNYPGTGIFWLSPEMSQIKNPKENTFGNDTIDRYGAEIRRFVLHQTDLAQPYINLMTPSESDVTLFNDASCTFQWQVNGSLVVDETRIQWDTDSSMNDPDWISENLANAETEYLGGTGWDQASNGETNAVTYEKTIHFPAKGEFFVQVKAKVDQVYKEVIQGNSYDKFSYLRLIQERTNASYYELINGTDGIQEINGSLWWKSHVIRVRVAENNTDFEITKPKNAFYFYNKEVFNASFMSTPVVFGSIEILLEIVANQSFVDYVTFFVDGKQVGTDDTYPYSFFWDEKTFGFKELTFAVVFANGVENEKTLSLWKLF